MNVFVKSFGRRPGLVLVPLLLLTSLCSVPAQTNILKAAPRRPSIILIIADDLGYGDLGCYGQKDIKTPNLDQLAAEGLRFTSFYGGAASGAASRASVLTGRNAAHLGSGQNLLPPDATIISQLLKNSGYRTGYIGQWGLNDSPDRKGVDQVAVNLYESDEFDHYPLSWWRADNVLNYPGREMQFPDNENGQKKTYFPDLFAKAGMNFVADNKPDQFNKFRSFFLCLSLNVPHAKLDYTDNSAYAAESWPAAAKTRAAMITRLDTEIGAVRKRLEISGQTNNVLILFMSGNGPDTNLVDPKIFNSTGGLRGGKNGLYEGGIRVPLIAWFPGHIKPGVNNTAGAACDILPTLADMALEKSPEGVDGASLWPTLLGVTHSDLHKFLYWEDSLTGARAVRMSDWKAVRPAAGTALELYDLKTDSHEAQNVAAKNPAIVSQIEDYLKSVRP
jgi:arylsulfatase A-like enzyme